MAKKKYYVVWVGHRPGIYLSWHETSDQVKAYPEAKFKSFSSMTEAEQAYEQGWKKVLYKKAGAKKSKKSFSNFSINYNSIAVDAACSGNPGDMEYRGVKTADAEEIFKMGPFKMGTNNVGEFLALVHALALLKKMGRTDIPIYSDSRIAIGWIKKKKANTKLAKTKTNEEIFNLLDRAHSWLANNKVENTILKWETKVWGEIPADFGRK